jgi:ribosomal protein S18 acetylase RimI-like enzyme
MEVRRAQEKDIGRINELLSQVDMVHHVGRPDLFKIGRKYTDSQLLDIISDDARPVFVAADDDGNVLGHAFCVFKQYLNNNIMTDIKTLYIDDICVDEKSRGQHVGTALYDFVINFAKENSCYNVTLNVWNCNKSAMKFYQALGLVPQKTGMEKIL